MSPEHGSGPEDRDFTPSNEEMKLEREAREEARLQRIDDLKEHLRSVELSLEEVTGSNQSNRDEILKHLEHTRQSLEHQLDELEGNG